MNVKVLFDMVMAVKIENEEKPKEQISKGGIIISTSPDEENNSGLEVKVTNIGEDVKNIKVGDRVLIQSYGNNEVTVQGTPVLIFRENVAICVLQD